jgi:hypothetical protein
MQFYFDYQTNLFNYTLEITLNYLSKQVKDLLFTYQSLVNLQNVLWLKLVMKIVIKSLKKDLSMHMRF